MKVGNAHASHLHLQFACLHTTPKDSCFFLKKHIYGYRPDIYVGIHKRANVCTCTQNVYIGIASLMNTQYVVILYGLLKNGMWQ